MSKELSAIIKGIAILLMLIYHLSNIHGIQGLDNVFNYTLSTASYPVCYFLIVSGYGLYYVYRQGRLSMKHLVKRSCKLYIAFWIVLLIFVVGLASLFYPGRFSLQWDDLIPNFLGWRWGYSHFTWFLLPYILMSFSAKWVFRAVDYLGNLISLLCSFFIYLVCGFLISRYFDSWLQWHMAVYHVVLWAQTLFTMTIGAVMARMVLSGKSLVWDRLNGKNLLVFLLLVLSFAIRGQVHTSVLNPFHATLVVWLVLHLRISGLPKIVLTELGNKSMLMWLAHGFLGVAMFTEYITLLRWPVLIWITWVVVSYLVACLLKPLADGVARAVKLS